MGWDPNARYRILGKLIRTKTETIFVFDLSEQEIFRRKGEVSYPEGWNDSFGVSAEDHGKNELVSFCENSSVFYMENDPKEHGEPENTNEIEQPDYLSERGLTDE